MNSLLKKGLVLLVGITLVTSGRVHAQSVDPTKSRSELEAELAEAVREAIGQLPGIHRAVILLHSIEGLTLREAAAALDIPIGTAKSRLNAAFAMLRRSLREWKGEVG